MLKEHFNLLHLSTGDLLREEIRQSTALGLEAKSFMDKGELVPDEVVIGMIGGAVDQAESQDKNGIIFDGFPRTVAQAAALDSLLESRGTAIAGVLSLAVDEEELTQRILKRGLTSGRSDDSDEATIRKRVQEYRLKTEPVAAYYAEYGKVRTIEGVGSIADINAALLEAIEALD
jgi:adenylate kinase